MQSGCGSGYRSAFSGVDGLITVSVAGRIFARDIRRKRYMSDALDLVKKIVRLGKPDVAFTEFASGDHLCLEFVVLSEVDVFSDSNLAPRTDQAFPFVGIFA
jgi:hypothetical protein